MQQENPQLSSSAYRRIASKLQQEVQLMQLHFIDEIALLFKVFLQIFLTKVPIICTMLCMMCGILTEIDAKIYDS
jgi:hypothetical protein